MVCVIAIVSQKGGVGKSTAARALAREATLQSSLRVKLVDLDTMQKTTSDWHAERLKARLKPVGDVQILATIEQALERASAHDVIIQDAPARAPKGKLSIAKHAHLLIQPTGPAYDDIWPAIREFNDLVQAGIPKKRLVFLLNHITTRAEETKSRALLEESGYEVLKGSLFERPAYRTAQNIGRSITETNYPMLNRHADILVQSVFDKISNGNA